jgi:acetyltransferase-like isoleucine patch superfamily enzyme
VRGRLERLIVVFGYAYMPKVASRLRMVWTRLRNPRARISFGTGCYLGPGFSIKAPAGGTFACRDYTSFRRRFRAELAGPDARIEIGKGSYATYDVFIDCRHSVEIGDRVGLGQFTCIDDAHGPIRIGDDVQVHSKVTITADLGERVIVGANAAITEPAPPFTVVGGVPARVLDYYGPPGGEPEGWQPREKAVR